MYYEFFTKSYRMLSQKYTQFECLAKTEIFPGNINIILSLFRIFFLFTYRPV